VYAIVRNGGRQEKVSVGDTLLVDDLTPGVGDTITLPAVLLVDDGVVTSDLESLSGVSVQAEVLGAAAGPKIHILKYKNKTGYRKRQGHRQHYTRVKVTAINTAAEEKA
jgi:large subunit ribosomal protein L21